MDQSTLPVLNEIVRENTVDVGTVSLYIIQHVKKNTLEYIRLLKRAGFLSITLIGKSYSVDKEALREIKKLARVYMPSFAKLEHSTLVKALMKSAQKKRDPFLCFDLGGYFSRYFSQLPKPPPNLLGIIEETKNGIWFAENERFLYPFVSIASARLKRYGECNFVAKAIIRSTESILINTFQYSLVGKNILVLGFGNIGSILARDLRGWASVTVHDHKPTALLRASIEGFPTLRTLAHLDRFDVIIGITGSVVLDDTLSALKDGVFLVNGSTRRREFDESTLLSLSKKHVLHHAYDEFFLKNNKKVYRLAGGYPINFHNTESIPEYILDLLFAETFILGTKMIKKTIPAGFTTIESSYPDIEENIAHRWLSYWEKNH